MTVTIKPNNKCNNCHNYVDAHCLARSVPRFCGPRYQPIRPVEKPAPAGSPRGPRKAP